MAKPRPAPEPEAGPQQPLSPGDRLRSAREAQGLTVQDVAARLHLDARLIANLEENAFERFAASAYVRGYLRAYARLVNVDPTPLLSAFDHHAEAPPDLTPYASSPEPQASAADFPVKAVTYLVVFSLVALLGVWLLQTQKLSTLTALTIPKWGEEKTTAAVGRAMQTEFVERTPPAPQPPAFSYSYPVVEHPAQWGRSEAQAPQGQGEAVATPAPSAQPPVEVEAGADATLGPVTAEAGGNALSLDLAADSWIEVYDAGDRRLYYDLARKDSRVAVQGTPPYRIRLGNAPSVRVNFAGQDLDVRPFTYNGVARFQIAADGVVSQ